MARIVRKVDSKGRITLDQALAGTYVVVDTSVSAGLFVFPATLDPGESAKTTFAETDTLLDVDRDPATIQLGIKAEIPKPTRQE